MNITLHGKFMSINLTTHSETIKYWKQEWLHPIIVKLLEIIPKYTYVQTFRIDRMYRKYRISANINKKKLKFGFKR